MSRIHDPMYRVINREFQRSVVTYISRCYGVCTFSQALRITIVPFRKRRGPLCFFFSPRRSRKRLRETGGAGTEIRTGALFTGGPTVGRVSSIRTRIVTVTFADTVTIVCMSTHLSRPPITPYVNSNVTRNVFVRERVSAVLNEVTKCPRSDAITAACYET